MRARIVLAAVCTTAILALVQVRSAATDVFWGQWGRTAQHDGFAPAAGQPGSNILANVVYDPFIDKELGGDGEGALLVHYQTPLISGIDVFMAFKSGRFATVTDWQTQTWGERKYSWVSGQLELQWEFASDWKPVPFSPGKDGPGWEPVFHGVLTDAALFVPGFAGTVWKVDRATGRALAHINPFQTADPNIYAVGPLSADAAGNVYYNVLELDGRAGDPWLADVASSWLVRVAAAGDAAKTVAWSALVPGAPAPTDQCSWQYSSDSLPWPVLNADRTPARPPTVACGSQRPPVNTAPAIGPDGTIYDISRAAFDDYYGYLIAIDKDLTVKWVSSMRNRFNDGCGTPFLPSTGTPGGCRAGAPNGVSPPDGMPGSGRVLDDSTSAPVVAPDGSIYYGAYTRYNYGQGHLMRWSNSGQYLAAAASGGGFEFGWDTTPAIFQYTSANGAPTFAVITKENHYRTGSYCGNASVCPPDRDTNHPRYPEEYFITSLTPDLTVNWRWRNTNTASCERTPTGELTCTADHPRGFEWCVNAPAVDADGTVFANSEDGNLYEINRNGLLLNRVFTQLAIGAAYTPLSIGPDGRIYTQNAGRLFAIGF